MYMRNSLGGEARFKRPDDCVIVFVVRLCIKPGRGHWEACVGTWDLETSSMGRGDVWDGDAGDVNEYCKSLR